MNNDLTNNPPINVTVVEGTIVCEPDCKIVQMGKGDVHVVWTLSTSGYEFPTTDAVVMKALPNPNFPDSVLFVNAQNVSLKDCCHSKDTFSYTISVKDSATGELLILDPVIQNENVSI